MRREYVTVHRSVDPHALTAALTQKEWKKVTPLVEWIQHYTGPAL
jgi:hypothetical protein